MRFWSVAWVFLIMSATAARPVSRNEAFVGYSETSGERILLSTQYGDIRIRAYHDAAPHAAKLVTELARKGSSSTALNFYRHEHAPANFGVDGFYGPPYALLQGSLAEIAEQPAFENGIDIRRGHVCFIPSCKEFFIATAPHTEWQRSHAVWGEVDDFDVIDQVPYEPSFTRADNSQPPIVTTWLNESIPFRISLQTS